MLDDLRKIHERDSKDALGMVAQEWEQLATEGGFMPTYTPGTVSNVVYAGAGESVSAALLARSWLSLSVPFEVVSGYGTPEYVGADTLFVACGYSGDTEETLAALAQAEAAGAQIAVITGGGRLLEIAQQKNYPLGLLPPVRQARFVTLSNLKLLTVLLEQAGLCTVDWAEVAAAADSLKHTTEAWQPTVAVKDNQAKQIAQECMGKSIAVYAGSKLAPAAYKWKVSINESAKQVAWWGQYPECTHNELTGWSKQPEQKPYAVIELRSELEHPRVQKQLEVAERLLSGLRPAPLVVEAQGKTVLQQLLWAVVLGDFVGVYLGLLNGVDPTPLELAEKFKQRLSE